MPLISGAFFFLLLDKKMALYISTGIIGACTGAITSVAVTITKELFGTKGFATNYNLLIANIPLGSFAFGYGAASLYRKEGKGACMGMECYRTMHFHHLEFSLCCWDFPCFNPRSCWSR
jgi:hypothetical protein